MTKKDILQIAFRTGGIYLMARVLLEIQAFSVFWRRDFPADGPYSELQIWGAIALVFLLGASAYLMRGAPHLLNLCKVDAQPFATPIQKQEVIALIFRIFGVFFATQTLLFLPRFAFSIKQVLFESEGHGIIGTPAMAQTAFNHAALGLGIYTIIALYLLRGAPHLVRFMKLDAEK